MASGLHPTRHQQAVCAPAHICTLSMASSRGCNKLSKALTYHLACLQSAFVLTGQQAVCGNATSHGGQEKALFRLWQ